MGGVGARFADVGYRQPKPLVNIVGRPILFRLLDCLSLGPDDVVWVAMSEALDTDYAIADRLSKEFPSLKIEVVHLTFRTRGATETLLAMLESMDSQQLSRMTISLDCDTLYFEDVLTRFRQLPAHAFGCCFYFEDTGTRSIYSYLSLDDQGAIVDIVEKSRISSYANTGAYGFRSGTLLREHCILILDAAVGGSGEYYTSSVVKSIQLAGGTMLGVPAGDFACVGTPAELEAFLDRVRLGTVPMLRLKSMRFCFDLDNTLVTYPRVEGDYGTVKPKDRMISLLRDLKAAGHYIIIATARRMKTHGGNVGAAVRDIGLVTLQTLNELDIPHDEIHFGKPQADVYIDDLAVNALADPEKEVGWAVSGAYRKQSLAVPSRHFNSVLILNDVVVKSSLAAHVAGELYFYENIPPSVSKFFPRLREYSHSENKSGVCSFAMDLVDGAVYSHMLVTRCLTVGRVRKLLVALHALHNCVDAVPTIPAPDVYAN